ncbi:hypothetical protein CDAR_554961 [Caerostris darwini]|uniref:Uncharacterized protein n=1 Tax=Caerostris darwini TaxID=1538125 RepID=A0AAV4RKF6_9ARAC|nr:hypothetical protein CDAR_554961 [Caerostris darwini]
MDKAMDIANALLALRISGECGVKNATKNEEILSTSSDPEERMNVIEICCHASDPEKPFIHLDRKVQGASPVSKKQSYSVRKVQGALPGTKKQFFSVARKVKAALAESEKQSFSDAGKLKIPRKQLLPAAGKVQGASSVPQKQSIPAAGKVRGAPSVPQKQSISAAGKVRGAPSVPQKESLAAAGKVQGASSVPQKQSIPAAGKSTRCFVGSSKTIYTCCRESKGASSIPQKQSLAAAGKVQGASSIPQKQSIPAAGKVQGASSVPQKQSIPAAGKVQGASSIPQKQSIPAAGKVRGASSIPQKQSDPNKEIVPEIKKEDGTTETFKLEDFTRSIEINAVSKLNFQLFTEEYLEEMMNVIRGSWGDDNCDYKTYFRLFADMLAKIREYITDLHNSVCTLITDIVMVGLRSKRRRKLWRLTISNSLSVTKHLRKSKEGIDEGSRAIDFLIKKTDGFDNLESVNDPPEPVSKEKYLVLIGYRSSMRAIYSVYKCYCLAFEDVLNVRACCERYFAEFQY